MLIVQLKHHFPARWPEWFMSGVSFAWGGYVVLHPEVFTDDATQAALSGMVQMAGDYPPSAIWGLSAVVMGLVRAAALFVNGAYTRTPLIRLCMSFASAFVWTQVFVGLIHSGVPNPNLVVYGGLVVLDIVSAYRAATDAVFAEKVRYDLRRDSGRGRRSNFA